MRKLFGTAALALAMGLGSASAEPLQVPEPAATPAVTHLPQRGITMAEVERQFGEPQQKHAPAGGDAPRHPPITRWDYDGFSVFFERDRVIDAVVPGQPPELHHTDELTPGN